MSGLSFKNKHFGIAAKNYAEAYIKVFILEEFG